MSGLGTLRAWGKRGLAALLMPATGCAAQAQPACAYDLYIYQPVDGAEIYAVAGAGGAAAVEVRGCGDARLLPEARAVAARLDALRARHDGLNLVTIDGPGSRTEIGRCAPGHFERARDGDDNLVLVRGASASQMRRTIATLDAAPRPLREAMIAAAGLRRCVARD